MSNISQDSSDLGRIVITKPKSDDEQHLTHGQKWGAVALVSMFNRDGQKWAIGVPLYVATSERGEAIKLDKANVSAMKDGVLDTHMHADPKRYMYVPLNDNGQVPYRTNPNGVRDKNDSPLEMGRIDPLIARDLARQAHAAWKEGHKGAELGVAQRRQPVAQDIAQPGQTVLQRRQPSLQAIQNVAERQAASLMEAIQPPAKQALQRVANAFNFLETAPRAHNVSERF